MKLLPTLLDLGLEFSTDGNKLLVGPVSTLTDPLRRLIRDNKAELVIQVRAAETLTAETIAAINAACDARGDDDANRAGLIDEVSQLSPELQEDARQHFDEVARLWRSACGKSEA